MPATSKKQFNFFKMLEHDPEKAKKKGIKPSVAKEYTSHNKGSMAYKNLPSKK